jgi:hypothetical protein
MQRLGEPIKQADPHELAGASNRQSSGLAKELCMGVAARIGIGLFGLGALTGLVGWLPTLVVFGVDAAAATALVGVFTSVVGATIWFLCLQ